MNEPRAVPDTPVPAGELTTPPEPVEKILKSRAFALAPALRSLLSYLWQHREEPISEYAVAVEALGRGTSFDAKLDATVRVQVSRLRQRLERYYEQEGQADTVRLIIPLGSHQIRVEAAEPISAPAPDDPWSPRARRTVVALAVICVVLLVACIGLGTSLISARNSARGPLMEAGRFWKTYFANGRPTRVVLPSPVFFSFPAAEGSGAVMLRDTHVNDFLAADDSVAIQKARKVFGRSGFAENYTVTSDTFAAVQLARYLEGCGYETRLHSSSEDPLSALDNENMVAIGTRGTLNSLRPYFDRMSFRPFPGDYDVKIGNAQPGEPKQFPTQRISSGRSITPGIIGLLPSRNGRTKLLVLIGVETSSLVSFLTSANGLDQLDKMWRAHGSPEYFEVAVAAEISGKNVVRFWPFAMHPIARQ